MNFGVKFDHPLLNYSSPENSQFSANNVAKDGLQPTGGQSESGHAENGTTIFHCFQLKKNGCLVDVF